MNYGQNSLLEPPAAQEQPISPVRAKASRRQSNGVNLMKVAAVLTLVLALALGFGALYDMNDSLRTRIDSHSDWVAQRMLDEEQRDDYLMLVAVGIFIASIVMFAKSHPSN